MVYKGKLSRKDRPSLAPTLEEVIEAGINHFGGWESETPDAAWFLDHLAQHGYQIVQDP